MSVPMWSQQGLALGQEWSVDMSRVQGTREIVGTSSKEEVVKVGSAEQGGESATSWIPRSQIYRSMQGDSVGTLYGLNWLGGETQCC